MVGGIAQLFGHFEELIYTTATAVAALVAMGTTSPLAVTMLMHFVPQFQTQELHFLGRRLIIIQAMLAIDAHQALGQHQLQGHGHHEAWHAHVHEAHRRR